MTDNISIPGLLRRLGQVLEALATFAAFAALKVIPLDWASALGGWTGRTFGYRLKVTSVARRNLTVAFPEKTPDEIEAIVRAMWDNVGRTAFEFPQLGRIMRQDQGGRVEVIGNEHFDALKEDGIAGIFYSCHLANWELPPMCASRWGLPIHVVYRAPNNPWMEWLFNQRRLPDKGMLIPKGPRGARQALRLLGKGEHLGMLVDQKMNDGIAVPFFGRDAMTAPALAQFALKYRCPVVPIRVERLHGARFKITYHAPMEITPSGDRKADAAAIMAEVNATIEDWIRQRPEQWLWLHNRWPE